MKKSFGFLALLLSMLVLAGCSTCGKNCTCQKAPAAAPVAVAPVVAAPAAAPAPAPVAAPVTRTPEQIRAAVSK